MSELDYSREGDDLVTDNGGATYFNFFSKLEADPFKAGVNMGACVPDQITNTMDFSYSALTFSLAQNSQFQYAISDAEQLNRFNQGWTKATALAIAFAFDEEKDDERFYEIVDALTFFGSSLDETTVNIATNTSRYLKRKEFIELQRGMQAFAVQDDLKMSDQSDFNGYTNFRSHISDLTWLLRGIAPYDQPEDNPARDAAAVVVADGHAKRLSSAFTTGSLSMQTEHAKTSIWEQLLPLTNLFERLG